MLRKVLIGLVVVCAALAVALFYPQVYVIRGEGGGVLYWNADSALLYMPEEVYGAHMSWARYLSEPFFLRLGFVHPTDDTGCSKIPIIRITDQGVETIDTELPSYAQNGCEFGFQLFEGNFYAVDWPKLWRWAGGTTFERSTPEEYGKYAAAFAAGSLPASPTSRTPWQFDNIDGWSMRVLTYTKAQHDLVLGGHPVTLIFHGPIWPPRPLSIDLTRPGKPPQTIWSFDEDPHRVSKAEYYHVFPPQD